METLMTYLPLILLTIMWILLLYLPQRKRNEERRNLMASLEVNDEVITSSGIIGKIIKIDGDVILLESGPERVRFRITKESIAYNETKEKLKALKAKEAKEKKKQ